MPKRLQEAGIEYQKGGEKNSTVKVRRKGRVTKVKGSHGKFKEKIKKDGTVKQVSWVDGKRTVEKFKRNSPDGKMGEYTTARPKPTPIPKADWKDLTPKQYGGQAIIKKESAKHNVSSEDQKYASDLYKNASKDQKKKAVDMYKQYQSTGEIPEGAEELYKSAGGNRFLRKGGAVGRNGVL